jgi:transcriptional regulator with XRE-family HTH domain
MSILNVALIKALREQKQWEQRDLAQAASLSPSVISRLENGLQRDCKLSVAVAIARAFGVTVDTLLNQNFQAESPSLTPRLQTVLAQLSEQPTSIQNGIAGMLQGYITTISKED